MKTLWWKNLLRSASVRKTAAVGFSIALSMSASAKAATVVTSGNTYGGWIVSTSPGVSLLEDSATSDVLTLEKTATLSSPALEGVMITFTEASTSATGQIDINNESLTNDTTVPWGGFQFLLANSNGSATFVQNANSPFAPAAGYTGFTFSSNEITYTGTQANATSSFWGFNADGDLIINSNPADIGTTFTLKEIPLPGTSVPVPLPASLWQGGAGLLALGALAFGKKMTKTA